MGTKKLIFGYLKGLTQRWYLVALAVFDFAGIFIQPFLPYEIPIWGYLIVFGGVFILANFFLYREGQEEILALKAFYEERLAGLKGKIEEIENRRPVLSLFFQTEQGPSPLQVIEVFNMPQQLDLDEMVQQEANDLKKAYAVEAKKTSSDITGWPKSLSESVFRHLKSADEYEKECKTYLDLYRHYLMTSYNYDVQSARFRSVSFAVQNSGMIPAEDITVIIHFPDEFYFLSSEEDIGWFDEERPTPPKRPTPFKSFMGLTGLDSISHLASPYNWGPPSISGPSNTSGPFIKPKNSTEVSYEVTKLIHNMTETDLDPAEFFVKEEAIGHSWELKYSLHAGNLPEPVNGSLILEVRLADPQQPETKVSSPEG